MRRIIMTCGHEPDSVDVMNRFICSKCNCCHIKKEIIYNEREEDRRIYTTEDIHETNK